MSSTFKFPLVNIPQTFQINIGGVEYLMTCKWNDSPESGWIIDLDDSNTNLPVIAGIPLVTGVDLLAGLEYLGIKGSLYVFTDGDDFAVPTLDNLGVESNLYFVTDVVNG